METGDEGVETGDAPHRPWAVGISLILAGLVLATFANVAALSAQGAGAALRAAGGLGYVTGMAVSGAGLHRLLWSPATPGRRWLRLLVTAIATPPVFAATGVVLGALMTVIQARFVS